MNSDSKNILDDMKRRNLKVGVNHALKGLDTCYSGIELKNVKNCSIRLYAIYVGQKI